MIYKKIAKKAVVPILLTSLLTPITFGVYADSLEDELSQNQQKVQQQKQLQEEAQQRITTFSARLKVVQDELAVATNELKSIQSQRQKKETEIVHNELLLKQAQERYNKRINVLKKRVRDIYINGKLSYFDVILGSKDFNDFINRVEFLKRIINADLELLDAIRAERAEIERTKQILENDRKQIIVLEKQAQDKKAVIQQKASEEQALLQKARTDKATAIRALEELEASSNEIRRQIQAREEERRRNSASSVPQHVGSGQFIWPVNGPITSPFGWRNHPIYGRQILHSGMDIGVPTGTPVHAADGGTVILSGWVSGYGYTVVIDHGNGFSTLYAHNSEVIVSSGQSVSQGQAIAYAGSTGNSTGPHVHFEVRVNGEPQNPLNYL